MAAIPSQKILYCQITLSYFRKGEGKVGVTGESIILRQISCPEQFLGKAFYIIIFLTSPA